MPSGKIGKNEQKRLNAEALADLDSEMTEEERQPNGAQRHGRANGRATKGARVSSQLSQTDFKKRSWHRPF